MPSSLYKIGPELDINIVGDSRQIEGVVPPYLLRHPWSFLRLTDPLSDIFDIDLPRFRLSSKAIITDYMDLSYSGRFKLISPNLKKIIDKYHVDNVDFYDVQVIDLKENCYNYYLITSRQKVIDSVVNWRNSSFVWWDMYADEIKQTIDDIKSYSDWIKYWTDKVPRKSENWRIRFSHVVLNSYDFDFVELSSPLLGFFVSTDLKRKIEEEQITGINFSSIEQYEVTDPKV